MNLVSHDISFLWPVISSELHRRSFHSNRRPLSMPLNEQDCCAEQEALTRNEPWVMTDESCWQEKEIGKLVFCFFLFMTSRVYFLRLCSQNSDVVARMPVPVCRIAWSHFRVICLLYVTCSLRKFDQALYLWWKAYCPANNRWRNTGSPLFLPPVCLLSRLTAPMHRA